MKSHASAGQGEEAQRTSESQSQSVCQTDDMKHWQMQGNVCRKEQCVEF